MHINNIPDHPNLEEIKRRFMAKVEKTNGCWLWTAGKLRFGYGRFRLRPSEYLSHRLAYVLFIGPISAGLCVLHKCDNPSCIRPSHLFLGTQKDNVADMVRKNRQLVGEANGYSILTENQVLKIRLDLRPHKIIAQNYGVHRATISKIKRRESWAYLT